MPSRRRSSSRKDYGKKWPKTARKITGDLDELPAFYDFPAEHWIHLCTTNPIEIGLRDGTAQGRGHPRRRQSRGGPPMVFKHIESAQAHWRAVNAPHLIALVRAGAKFENGKLVERPDESGGDQQVA
ncbi:hypothetical protein GCM10010405_23420 [Streptomyces macrosporus]|uniref:Mutator family transposase n=1 Tax=Streptomyces macrosporus TaxID=44032 RepID=A0ABN3JT25_9ACTN